MKITFDIKSTNAIVVTCPGATHYKVATAMLESGLLVDNGFDTLGTSDTVVLIPREGIDSVDVMERLSREIEKLLGTGEVRIS